MAWVKTAYQDATGSHAVGEQIDFPLDTDAQKLVYQRLLRYGIITEEPPPAPPEDVEEKPRTRRKT